MTSNGLADFSEDAAAAPILDLLRDGKCRKARDAAKQLCKQDRDRYLPLLIESNVGLVRAMLAKGLLKDAKTVIDYLESIAPANLIATLRSDLAMLADPASADKAANSADWVVALRLSWGSAPGKETSPKDLAAVDSLVVGEFVPTEGSGNEAGERLAAELAVVRQASNATGDGRWEDAKQALRGLPQHSVFRHWRMFLRGVRCIFEEDVETARRCFGMLPSGGSLAIAAEAFDPASGGPTAPASARVPLLLAATGGTAGWSKPIISAAREWKAGKCVRSYEILKKGLKGDFPTQRPGLGSALTDTIIPYSLRMSDEDYFFADGLSDKLTRVSGKRSRGMPEEILILMRSMCVAGKWEIRADELESSWEMVLGFWTDLEGPDRVRDSAAWRWLGETLTQPGVSHDRMYGYAEEPDLPRARVALEKSVKCDPNNEAAWLKLLGVITLQRDAKTHNRLLGEVVKRFPSSKKILALAGEEALGRKTYVKSLKLLEAALALDPLDKDIKVSILVARVFMTREFLRKGRPAAEQWALMEPLLEDRPGRGHLMLARWIARVRQSLLDPDPETSARARSDAGRLAPSRLAALFLESALAPLYKVKAPDSWKQDWKVAMGAACWSDASQLLELLGFIQQVDSGRNQDGTHGSANWLKVSRALLTKGLDKDLEGLLSFVEQSAVSVEDRESPAGSTQDEFQMELDSALRKRLKRRGKCKKADPRLRLAHLRLLEITGEYEYVIREEFFNDVDVAIADAAKLGMSAVVEKLEALRIRMNAPQHPPGGDERFEAPFDGGFYDEEEDVPSGGDDLAGLLDELVSVVDSGDPRAIAALRARFVSMGIPEEVLEQTFRDFGLDQALPQKAKKKPKKKAVKKKPKKTEARNPEPPSPDQLDLF